MNTNQLETLKQSPEQRIAAYFNYFPHISRSYTIAFEVFDDETGEQISPAPLNTESFDDLAGFFSIIDRMADAVVELYQREPNAVYRSLAFFDSLLDRTAIKGILTKFEALPKTQERYAARLLDAVSDNYNDHEGISRIARDLGIY